MGGFGSGRRWGKDTTSDMRALDIRRLQRDSLLTPGRVFDWKWLRGGEIVASIQIKAEADRVILNYRSRNNGGEWQPMEYAVHLVWTGCNLGGRRAWFLCPARGCGRRVAILFGGSIFACRHCHKLAYSCQREADEERILRKANKIRERLGWKSGVMNGHEWKPKGMHWRTYWCLVAEHDALVNQGLGMTARRFGFGRKRATGGKSPT